MPFTYKQIREILNTYTTGLPKIKGSYEDPEEFRIPRLGDYYIEPNGYGVKFRTDDDWPINYPRLIVKPKPKVYEYVWTGRIDFPVKGDLLMSDQADGFYEYNPELSFISNMRMIFIRREVPQEVK